MPPLAWSPPRGDGTITRSPMEQLIEMGFADRRRNEQLLQKYGADMQRIIQELIDEDDNNDWHTTRH